MTLRWCLLVLTADGLRVFEGPSNRARVEAKPRRTPCIACLVLRARARLTPINQASSSDKGAVDASETVTPDLRIAPA